MVLLAKNAATLTISLASFLAIAAAAAPFFHQPPGARDLLHALLHLGTLMFPLLVVGNMRSLQDARPDPGWQVSDLTEAFGMLVTATVLSLPFWIAAAVSTSLLPVLLIAAAGAALWMLRSLPATARHIRQQRFRPWNPEILR
jgi:hypothetical protein